MTSFIELWQLHGFEYQSTGILLPEITEPVQSEHLSYWYGNACHVI